MNARLAPLIEFLLDPTTLRLDRAQVEQLVATLFQDQPDVVRVSLDQLPGSSAGLSSISLLLALPFTADGVQHNPMAIRIGHREVIRRERDNYQRYVAHLTGMQRVQLHRSSEATTLAAIGYDYLGQGERPIRTLREHLWLNADQGATIAAVRALFLETLTRDTGPLNGWHQDARPYAQQRPLWFYNRVLPPTLTLADLTIGGTPDSAEDLATMLALADHPPTAKRPERLTLAFSAPQRAFRLEDDRPVHDGVVRLRLHLLEGAVAEQGLYRPLEPLAARLELQVAVAELPQVLAALTKGEPVGGRIVGTRYEQFRTLVATHDLRTPGDAPGLNLAHAGRTILDPMAHYHALLSPAMTLHTSIIHGDMNLGNLLIRERGHGRKATTTAWLIDFDLTMPGGHTVFDAVKLETEYKLHLLPHRFHSPADFLRLETALHAALINPNAVEELLHGNTEITQAYEFIAAVRRTALYAPRGARPHPAEYYLGLLGYGLAALKYRNLYASGRAGWLLPSARVEPLAVAAYISAAFAATALDEARQTAVVTESYPSVAGRRVPLRRPPRLIISQDVLVEQIYRQLRGEVPLAVVHGGIGGGREAIAEAVCYELERAGYLVVAPGNLDLRGVHEDVTDALGDAILDRLEAMHGVTGLPERLTGTSPRLTPGRRRIQLQAYSQHLAAALADDDRTFALVLTLRGGDPDLADFAIALGRTLTTTALLIIAGTPLVDLPAEAHVAVPPLSREDLRVYGQRRQLRLPEATLDTLLKVSYGLPGLVEELMTGPSEQLEALLHGSQLERMQGTSAREIFGQLSDHVQFLAGLEALLHTYGHGAPTDLEAVAVRLGALAPWATSKALREVVGAYRAEVANLSELLRETALAALVSHPHYAGICAAASATFATRTPPQLYLAARYAALAGNWQGAEGWLQRLVAQPASAHGLRQDQLMRLAHEVAASGQARDVAALWQLVGDCAAFLGRYAEALDAYHQIVAGALPQDSRVIHAIARMLTIYQAAGRDSEADETAAWLRRVAPADQPLAVLAVAHEGVTLVKHGQAAAAEPSLRDALARLEVGHTQLGDLAQRDTLELRIRLSDWLARALIMQGHFTEAVVLLATVRGEAIQAVGDRALVAMLDNDLGIAYTRRGLPGDRATAKTCFERSFAERQALGDHAGMLRTSQNLAIDAVELATSAADWAAAERFYTRVITLAETVLDHDATQIYGNYLELLIRQGRFGLIDTILAQVAQRQNQGGFTRARGDLNRAKAALWRDDPQTCADELAALAEQLTHDADQVQQVEWATLTLELALRFGHPYPDSVVANIAARTIDAATAPLAAAGSALLRGLLARAHGALTDAQQNLTTAETLWRGVGYAYNAAVVCLWQTEVALQAAAATAPTLARRALDALAPFGATPTLHLAQTYLARTEGA